MTDEAIQEKRRHERYPVYCPLEYKSEDDHPKESSITLNISEGGALISARRGLDISSNVIVKIMLQSEHFYVIGKVRHVRRALGGEDYEIGLEFWDKPRSFAGKFLEEIAAIDDYRRKCSEENGSEISLAEASMEWYRES